MTVQGAAGVWLLQRMGGQIDLILRRTMSASGHAGDVRGPGTHRFLVSVCAGRQGGRSRKDYDGNWPKVEKQYRIEKENITIHPREDRLVKQLTRLKEEYHEQGEKFWALPRATRNGGAVLRRRQGTAAAARVFRELKGVVRNILTSTSRTWSRRGPGQGPGVPVSHRGGHRPGRGPGPGRGHPLSAGAVAGAADRLRRAARPSAKGSCSRTCRSSAHDELAQLAVTFNIMARRLRDYRQSSSARLLRSQQTSQATIDSFPDPVLVVDPRAGSSWPTRQPGALLGVTPRPLRSRRRQRLASLAAARPVCVNRLSEALPSRRPSSAPRSTRPSPFASTGRPRLFAPVRPIRDPYGTTLGAAVVLNDVTQFRLLDQIKSDLVATVSHELKTPLTSIRLALHLLLEETIGPLRPSRRAADRRPRQRRAAAAPDRASAGAGPAGAGTRGAPARSRVAARPSGRRRPTPRPPRAEDQAVSA